MKKALIVALVCINVALLVTLVLGSHVPQARAQAFRGGANYLMATGHISTDVDAIYILNLGGRQLGAWRMDTNIRADRPPRFIPFRGRDLRSDFRRTEQD